MTNSMSWLIKIKPHISNFAIKSTAHSNCSGFSNSCCLISRKGILLHDLSCTTIQWWFPLSLSGSRKHSFTVDSWDSALHTPGCVTMTSVPSGQFFVATLPELYFLHPQNPTRYSHILPLNPDSLIPSAIPYSYRASVCVEPLPSLPVW